MAAAAPGGSGQRFRAGALALAGSLAEQLAERLAAEHEREVAGLQASVARLQRQLPCQELAAPPPPAPSEPLPPAARDSAADGGPARPPRIEEDPGAQAAGAAAAALRLRRQRSSTLPAGGAFGGPGAAGLPEEGRGAAPPPGTGGGPLRPGAVRRASKRQAAGPGAPAGGSRERAARSSRTTDCDDAKDFQMFMQRPVWTLDKQEIQRIRRRSVKLEGPHAGSEGGDAGAEGHGQSEAMMSEVRVGSGRCTVHPQAQRRLVWDLVALALLAYDMITIPLQAFSLPHLTILEVMDWIIVVYWTLDVVASFLTGVYINGKLDMRPQYIARHYSRTWLPFDLVLVLPEWVMLFAGRGAEGTTATSVGLARALKGIRFLRFLRFLRVIKAEKVWQDLKARINNNIVLLCFSISRLIMGTIIMIHLLACFWFALGKGSTRGWIYQERIDNASFGDQYLVSFQWSMARLHPSTFGENMSLETTRERIFSIIVSLFALCGGGVFISSITNTMAQLQAYRQQRTRKLWVIRAYVRENHISTQLSVRVKKYVEKSLGRKLREQHAAELVQMLPHALLMDLHFEAWSPHVCSRHRFFGQFCREHPRTVWSLGREALQEVPVLAGDTLFTAGDVCHRVLFVMAGEFSYALGRGMVGPRGSTSSEGSQAKLAREWSMYSWAPSDLMRGRSAEDGDGEEEAPTGHEARFSDGDCFSEPVLWTAWENRGELRAMNDSTLLALSAEGFIAVAREHESATLTATARAALVVNWLNTTIEDLSDLVPSDLGETTGAGACVAGGGTVDGLPRARKISWASIVPATYARRPSLTASSSSGVAQAAVAAISAPSTRRVQPAPPSFGEAGVIS